MNDQEAMFEADKLDPEVAKVADRYIDLNKQKKSLKERLEAQECNLIGLLRKIGKFRVRHRGHIIEVTHKDESEHIKLKEEKGAKGEKKGRRRKK